MKRIKIMLLSLAVLGAAGGLLAFKAKFFEAFCTTEPIFNACPFQCPNLVVNSTTTNDPWVPFVCTTFPRYYEDEYGELRKTCFFNNDPAFPIWCGQSTRLIPN